MLVLPFFRTAPRNLTWIGSVRRGGTTAGASRDTDSVEGNVGASHRGAPGRGTRRAPVPGSTTVSARARGPHQLPQKTEKPARLPAGRARNCESGGRLNGSWP